MRLLYFSNLFFILLNNSFYVFRTDILSITRSLDTVYTALGVCHAEILKAGKITSVYTCTL